MSRPAYPDNWSWQNGPVSAGPAVIVDVDGVIADGWHRQHFLQGARRDWKTFFSHAGDDTPVEGSVELLAHFDAEIKIILLTARPHYLRQTTIDWTERHGYRWELLVMRGRRDGGISSPEFKRRALSDIRGRGFEPRLAIDDDQRNVDMFRSEGVPTLYVHSGYYEA